MYTCGWEQILDLYILELFYWIGPVLFVRTRSLVYLLGRVICKSWFIWQQTYYQTYRKIDLKAGLFYTETFYSLISQIRFQPGILVETDQPYKSSLGLICSFELKSNVKPDLSLSSKTFIDYIYVTESLGKICRHWARPLAGLYLLFILLDRVRLQT